MKSNIVRRKLTNGPRVTAEKMRFLWRGRVTWEDAAQLCYKRPISLGGDHETAPEARGGTRRATSEANAPQSGPQVSVARLLFLHEVFTLTVSFPPSQKPTWWIVLILWLDSCSSSPSKVAGSFPTRTETPCKITPQYFFWNQSSKVTKEN